MGKSTHPFADILLDKPKTLLYATAFFVFALTRSNQFLLRFAAEQERLAMKETIGGSNGFD
ncbi:MAG: hypothetical protein D3921_01990 [Candidatus Electrothrix sp. AW1]|nr:hypothetical protein [Candidatus Electrothrix sp. AX1]MCI5181297.1 hypothetical protein [Candidatus Electrothrix gigas]